jgi:hypothetical protein
MGGDSDKNEDWYGSIQGRSDLAALPVAALYLYDRAWGCRRILFSARLGSDFTEVYDFR